jgi:hypothetical protein
MDPPVDGSQSMNLVLSGKSGTRAIEHGQDLFGDPPRPLARTPLATLFRSLQDPGNTGSRSLTSVQGGGDGDVFGCTTEGDDADRGGGEVDGLV